MADHLHCYACERIIREFADDIVLANKASGELRFFHSEGSCKEWATIAYFALAERDERWRYSERYAFWSPEEAEGLTA